MSINAGIKICIATAAMAAAALGQVSSSSSSSSGESGHAANTHSASTKSTDTGRIAQPEAAGAAITLETSEPLFNLAVVLNACGYDTDLKDSDDVRQRVRDEVEAAIAGSAEAKASRIAVCEYIHQHELSDKGRELAQYVSLALYLKPSLDTSVEQTEMPPDALQVVNILPLLKAFSVDAGLSGIWQRHRADYLRIIDRVHDSVTHMILETNVYLRLPVSSYDGRRYLVLVEPMLAPASPNARIYGPDYVAVTSPNKSGELRLDQVRHMYLHYSVEPLVYARAASTERLLPLLKPVQQAPLEFTYKSDIVALVTECLIKAIEARTIYTGEARPVRPAGARERVEQARYDEELGAYERRAEIVRRRLVDLDMRQGWILTEYFYQKLGAMEHDQVGLKEDIGEMVYGMDVGRERHRAEQIAFLPQGSGEFVKRAPRVPTGTMLAERKLLEGDIDGARKIATSVLDDPKADHSQASFVLARVQLMQGQPEESLASFEQVLKTTKDPHTSAWAHIYLGRLYDTQPDRRKAVAEYRAALAAQEGQPSAQDAKTAAERGLKAPFALPATEHIAEEPLDPTGKAEKDQYEKEHPELTQPAPPLQAPKP